MTHALDIARKPAQQRSGLIRLLVTAAAIASLVSVYAATAGATDYRYYDIGRGECRLRDMGSLGTGGTSTITAPVSTWSSFAYPGHSWVTVKAWTNVIDANTGQRRAEHFDGALTIPATASQSVTVSSVTLNIPDRSVNPFFFARVQVVLATYDYYTGALLEVDTGNVFSYWLYHNSGYIRDNVPVTSC